MQPRITPTETSLSTNQEPDAVPRPAPETVTVHAWKVSCDGDEARALGHPRVWLAISPDVGWVECPYCDKRFVVDPAQAHGDH